MITFVQRMPPIGLYKKRKWQSKKVSQLLPICFCLHLKIRKNQVQVAARINNSNEYAHTQTLTAHSQPKNLFHIPQ